MLQSGSVGAKADDDKPRSGHTLQHERPGGEQQVDALADDQLADERDQPVALGIEAARARAADESSRANASSPALLEPRAASARRAGAAGSARSARPLAPARVARGEPLDVHARWAKARAPLERWVSECLPQAGGGVMGADEDRASTGETLAGQVEEALRMRLDRVLERAAVNLDGVWNLVRQRTSEDDGAHHQMIGERDIGTNAAATSRTAATFASM